VTRFPNDQFLLWEESRITVSCVVPIELWLWLGVVKGHMTEKLIDGVIFLSNLKDH
jgi:hypothetical protein